MHIDTHMLLTQRSGTTQLLRLHQVPGRDPLTLSNIAVGGSRLTPADIPPAFSSIM